MIVIINRAAGAGVMNGFDLGDQFGYRANQCQRGIDHMRGKITHSAIGNAARTPASGGVWISIKIFSMLAAKPCNIANLAIGNELAGKLAGWGADIIIGHHIGDVTGYIGRFCGGDHGYGIIHRGTHWLFT